jgi:hypothetical protein
MFIKKDAIKMRKINVNPSISIGHTGASSGGGM